MHEERGFSLIELLIVCVVIAVIAAIAIPNLLAARRTANEASALVAVRKVSAAQLMYLSTIGNNNYGTPVQLYNQQLIGKRTAAAMNVNVGGAPIRNTARDGYRFRILTTPNVPGGAQSTFVISAIPTAASGPLQTGTRRLCLREDGVLKSASTSIGSHYNYNQCRTAAAFAR